jgi:hypothetical protein
LDNTLYQPQRDGVEVDSQAIHRNDRQRYEDQLALLAADVQELRAETEAVDGVLIYFGSDAPSDEAIGPSFEARGNWLPVNHRELYVTPGPDNAAIYRPNLEKPGRYRIDLWWGDDPNEDHSTQGVVEIHHADGVAEVQVNQRKNIGQWMEVGTYTFPAGPNAMVKQLANQDAGNYITLVVRFIQVD